METAEGKRLTQVQLKLMMWLSNGWSATPGKGAGLYVNGKRVCSVETAMALERQGMVERREDSRWIATSRGESLAASLGLLGVDQERIAPNWGCRH